MKNNSKNYRVAACVILYNSDIKVLVNINSYINQVDKLFVIDNSEVKNYNMIDSLLKLEKISYVDNGGNKGVANALNVAANKAISEDFDYLLTMDDDSILMGGAVDKMLTYFSTGGGSIGIIGGQSSPDKVENTVKYVPTTITSGNLLNLDAFKKCGPFLNDLFIDYVDHEFCLRLINEGFSIVEMNSIYLEHRLGLKKKLPLNLFSSFTWTSHSPERIYYKTRNYFFLRKIHPSMPKDLKIIFLRVVIIDFIKIILLEDKKVYRLKLFFQAFRDANNNKLGKYSE